MPLSQTPDIERESALRGSAVMSFITRERLRVPWILGLLNIDIEIPTQLQATILQLMNDFLAPLWMLSLGLLIAGVALLIVSFVYKPRQPSS